MRVADCMTRDVRLTSPDETIQEAAMTMAAIDAGCLPVREDDRLIGMITDRDIAVRAVAGRMGPDARVRDIMSNEVRYCFDDDEVDDVLRNMGDIQLRRLPVMNRDKRLVGIVSLADLASNGETPQVGQALQQIAQPGGMHSQQAH